MRVSTDPSDPSYIDDRPRKVWLNSNQVIDWLVADEFRRCIIGVNGKVYNGSVSIERLSAEVLPPLNPTPEEITVMTDAGFTGMMVFSEDKKKEE